jgi:hypothetical protein
MLEREDGDTGRPRVRGASRVTPVAALAAAVVVLVATVAGCGSASASRAAPPGSPCTPAERSAGLALDQRRVLDLVGDLTVLDDLGDLRRLAAPRPAEQVTYGLLAHMFVSMQGVGFAVLQVDHGAVRPGLPTLLFYRPAPGARDVLDSWGGDFPYTLAGWGYSEPYAPGDPPAFPSDPALRCLAPGEWMVHERSVHTADNWQNLVRPPQEEWLGQAAAVDPPQPGECARCTGGPHGRLWDLHVWLGPDPDVPQVSMFNPGPPIPGFDPVAGVGFFHPEHGPASHSAGS